MESHDNLNHFTMRFESKSKANYAKLQRKLIEAISA